MQYLSSLFVKFCFAFIDALKSIRYVSLHAVLNFDTIFYYNFTGMELLRDCKVAHRTWNTVGQGSTDRCRRGMGQYCTTRAGLGCRAAEWSCAPRVLADRWPSGWLVPRYHARTRYSSDRCARPPGWTSKRSRTTFTDGKTGGRIIYELCKRLLLKFQIGFVITIYVINEYQVIKLKSHFLKKIILLNNDDNIFGNILF